MSNTIVRITSPRGFVAVVPSLLGFQPQHSIVAVVLDPSALVLVTARFDDDNPGWFVEETLRGLVTTLRERGSDPESVVLAAYSDRLDLYVTPEDQPLAGLHVRDFLIVDPRKLTARSAYCHEDGCCPFTFDPADDVVAIEQGNIPAESRESIVESVQWDGVTDVRRLRGQSHTVSAADLSDVESVIFGGDPRLVDPQAAALLAAHCSYPVDGTWDVRDVMLGTLASSFSMADPHTVRVAPSVVAAYARLLSPEHRVTLVCLATLAYLNGDGALARILLDRVESEGEMPSLGSLLLIGLDRAMHPDDLRSVLVSALAEIDL